MENKKDILSPEQKKKNREAASRRSFLRKAAYSAPALIAMGQLVKPTKIQADGTGGPDGLPNDGWTP